MLEIVCQNGIYVGGEKRKCNRWLASLTDLQIDILKVDPEARFYLRCPACKPECRWITVTCINGILKFSSGNIKPSKAEEITCGDAEITEESA